MLSAEGSAFDFSRVVDASTIVGTASAVVDWGDGSTSPATVSSLNTDGPLKAVIRYDYDTRGFFTSQRRALLQAAADIWVERFTDSLDAIVPGGANTWKANFAHPSNRGQQVELTNLTINANEIVIYAGAQPLPSNQLGEGSFGGFSASGTSQAFLDSVATRGQSGAAGTNPTDFGPWGGSITFNSSLDEWYFGQDPSGIVDGQVDFVSVAMHEVAHLLGFGTAQSWLRLRSGNSFTGPKSRAAYDGSGNVPLNGGHWDSSVTDGGEATLLDPSLARGRRTQPTPLDFAALDDLGWTLDSRQVTVTGSHVYADDGVYDVDVVLRGNRLGEQTSSLRATVTNVNPTLTVSDNVTATVGQSLSIQNIGQISDPGFRNTQAGTDETFSYSIEWGDGSTSQTGSATIDQVGNATRPTLASFDGQHVYETSGVKTVRVTVSDDDGSPVSRSFQVTVGEPPELSLSLSRSSIGEDEGNGAAMLTVTRGSVASTAPALTVALASSDTGEARLAATAVIPAGQSSVNVSVNAVDDTLFDGVQSVILSASATGWIGDSIELAVTDAESITAQWNVDRIDENAEDEKLTLTVRQLLHRATVPVNVIVMAEPTSVAQMPNIGRSANRIAAVRYLSERR
ncbi:MAG: hypothetical protein R3C05_02340 [Pirellulaceae bacterium]